MAKILIVEDERDIRELVNLTLTFNGHEVVAARDGLEALDLVGTEEGIELILMDVRMPRMTGYEACKHLKESEETAHIPVVFLSAKGQESEVERGMEAGAAHYILKPFSPAKLVLQIAEILDEMQPQPA